MYLVNTTLAILGQSISQLRTRVFDTCAGILGITGVVIIFIAVLSLLSGINALVNNKNINQNAYVLLKSGADSELASFFTGPDTNIIAANDYLNVINHQPLISKELSMVMNATRSDTKTDANVIIRGISKQADKIYDLNITSGRMFKTGKKEIIVGEMLLNEFDGLAVNKTMRLGGEDWLIVGTFTSNVAAMSSEIWTDVLLVQVLFKRGDSYSRLVIDVNKKNIASFEKWLAEQPKLAFDIIKLDEYYQKQVDKLLTMITISGGVIALLVALGALSGLINTIFANIAQRKNEIAVLRALGFQSSAVATALFIEIIMLTVLGYMFGAVISFSLFNGESVATMNMSSFSQLVFNFDLSLQIYIKAFAFTVLIMCFASYFPLKTLINMSVNQAIKAIK